MNVSIYYFSGTGNSYRVAKSICGGFENARLINIAKEQNTVRTNSDQVIGIVFPLYYFGLPVIVEAFLRGVEIPEDAYVFFIVTRGVSMAGGVRRQLDAVFRGKDRPYHYLRYITMGNNFPFYMFNGSAEGQKAQRNQRADEKIAAILADIKAKKQSRIFSVLDYFPFPAVTLKLPTFGYQHFLQIYDQDSCFVVEEDRCNRCGKCQRVCPVDNVEVHLKVLWKHENCQMCLACYNCCPKNAVQYIDPVNKVDTRGKRQYWNFT